MRLAPLLLAAAACTGPGALDEAAMDDPHRHDRDRMVDTQLAGRDITDAAVLAAMRRVPRHRFVAPDWQALAHADRPVPLGHGATVSQPYIVARMTQLARVRPGDRVLEVGTGSGYQAAVLAELGVRVYSVEVVPELADSSARLLAELGYSVEVRAGDGWRGWPEHGPYQAILVTAAPPELPAPLLDQLAPGGRMIVPIGRGDQELSLIERRQSGEIHRETVLPVRFVPMTGEAQRAR